MKNNRFTLTFVLAAAMAVTFSGCGQVVSEASINSNAPSKADSTIAAADTSEPEESSTLDTNNMSDPAASESMEAPTVSSLLNSDDPDAITSISLSMTEVNLTVGQKKMPIVTMTPSTSSKKNEIWKSSDESIATVDRLGNITGVKEGVCTVTVTSEYTPTVSADVKVVVSCETASSGSSDQLTYIKGILIANKTYSLPSDYNPGLDPTTQAKFNELSAAAAKENLNIYLSSGFRSYDYQKRIYNNYSNIYGSETADTFSARPGHSEHQTGLAIDVNSIDDSFAGTPEAIWLSKHAHEYGFIIRYPADKVDITGYKYEPWHIRYLGVETATAVYNSGLCLEEYLGIDSKYR